MTFNKSLPPLKVSEQMDKDIHTALIKYNEKQNVPIPLQMFRRLAYQLLIDIIKKDKPIDIKIQI